MTLRLKPGTPVKGMVVEIYAAVTNTDLCEGRGRDIDHSYHFTRAAAVMGAAGVSVMGGDGKVELRRAIRLDFLLDLAAPSTLYILFEEVSLAMDPAVKADLRLSALAKLSDAEKVALLGEA